MPSERRQLPLLHELTLSAMVDASIALLRAHEPDGVAYYGAFSGGKDSVVIKELALQAGVRVVWHYHNTTIDPPELVQFIKRQHPDVVWTKPKHGNFFARMEVKGFPTRRGRWCCEDYKEAIPAKGSVMIFGVRAAESSRRAKAWQDVTFHTRTRAWCVSPVLRWSDAQAWEFIRGRGLPYCSLYDEGFARLGCIGCPMARKAGRLKEFARWPRYEALWRRAFDRIWARRTGTTQRDGRPWFGDARFHNAQEMWEWWLSNDSLPPAIGEEDEEGSCQLALDMLSGGTDGSEAP